MSASLALTREHECACFADCTNMGLTGMVFIRGYSWSRASADPICRHIWNSICGIAAMLTNRENRRVGNDPIAAAKRIVV